MGISFPFYNSHLPTPISQTAARVGEFGGRIDVRQEHARRAEPGDRVHHLRPDRGDANVAVGAVKSAAIEPQFPALALHGKELRPAVILDHKDSFRTMLGEPRHLRQFDPKRHDDRNAWTVLFNFINNLPLLGLAPVRRDAALVQERRGMPGVPAKTLVSADGRADVKDGGHG